MWESDSIFQLQYIVHRNLQAARIELIYKPVHFKHLISQQADEADDTADGAAVIQQL